MPKWARAEQTGAGVLLYAASTLLQESRFVRARQQEAAVRFHMNLGGTGSEPGICTGGASGLDTPGARAISGHTFAISNPQGHLCTAFVGRAGVGARLQPGDHLGIRLDFREVEQPCLAVKVELVKKVLSALEDGRPGVTVVRRDVLSSGARSTADALELNLRLALPADDAPSAGLRGMTLETAANSPLKQQQQQQSQQPPSCYRYWLEFSFHLAAADAAEGVAPASDRPARPPFSWGVPIDVQLLPDEGDSLQSTSALAMTAARTQQLFVAAD